MKEVVAAQITDDSKCAVSILGTTVNTIGSYRENGINMITGSIMAGLWNLSYRSF